MVEISLRGRIARLSPGPSRAVVYRVLLGGPGPTRADEASLSAREAARAVAIRPAHVRSRFVWCRAAVRYVLGAFLERAPAEVALYDDAAGRPFVLNADIDFNVSHSDDLALIALLPGTGSVGVDLERIVQIPDLRALAGIVCTAREREQLFHNRRDQLESFYRLWTCKEAYLKGIGSGWSAADAARVEIGVDGPVDGLRRRSPDGRSFSITTFSPQPEFVAALAVSTQ